MGFGGISPWSLLLILLIVVMLFGTKRLKSMGGDIGGAIKSFKKSMAEGEKDQDQDAKQLDTNTVDRIVEGEVKNKDKV